MNSIDILGITVRPEFYIPVMYFLWVSIFLVLKKIFFSRIRKFAGKTSTKVDDIFIYSMDLPIMLLIFSSGIFVLENLFEFSYDSELLKFVAIAFKATAIIAIIIFLDRLFKSLIENYAKKIDVLKGTTGILHGVVRGIVIGLGILVLLDSFGVSIAPVLASLGIGSLAVALALQPTLENFFSGIQLMIDRPIKTGHFIRLESGEEGYVEKIGWRSTWIRMLPDNIVVIPNKLLINSRILNYHYPVKEMSVLVYAGVHYDSDLEEVERIAVEVGKDVLENVEGGVPGFSPRVRFYEFNDSSIDFKVILRAKEFVDGYLLKHEFIKRLKKRFDSEGIVIPYPIRTLDWNDGSNPVKVSKT